VAPHRLHEVGEGHRVAGVFRSQAHQLLQQGLDLLVLRPRLFHLLPHRDGQCALHGGIEHRLLHLGVDVELAVDLVEDRLLPAGVPAGLLVLGDKAVDPAVVVAEKYQRVHVSSRPRVRRFFSIIQRRGRRAVGR